MGLSRIELKSLCDWVTETRASGRRWHRAGSWFSDRNFAQSNTLSSGGIRWVWILNQQRHDAAARYTTFNRHGAVILVTGLSRVGDSVISPAEQTAVQQVAARIGQRLQAER